MAKHQLDGRAISEFEEHIVVHGDKVFRFAIGLLLNEKEAHAVVELAFQKAADLFGKGSLKTEISLGFLLAEVWSKVKGRKPQEVRPQGEVLKAFESVPLEARGALLMIDVVGLTSEDASKCLQMDHKELRAHLAQGRRVLMASSLMS